LFQCHRQKDNPAKQITFNVFDQNGDGYTFLYDSHKKNITENRANLKPMEEGMQWITIPVLMELGPEGIALNYNTS
jgi:hypothetical protein